MRSRMAVGSGALLALIVLGVVFAAAAEKNAPAAHKATAAATAWGADEIQWRPMPGTDGNQYAPLWGDLKQGAYGAFVRRGPNQDHPLHMHTSTVKIVVLSGEMHYTPEGGERKVLGPGSYLMIPAKLRHTSGTGPDGSTVFQEGNGAWDRVDVAPHAAAQSK
jgi:ChrR-like protein with cupin domain